MTPIPETAAEFLRSRANWLRVETVDRPDGGWDVMLRIDGTYSAGSPPEEMAEHFRDRLLEVFRAEEIPPRELHAWARPVEEWRLDRKAQKQAWEARPAGAALAVTPGGTATHRPDCSVIRGAVEIAEAALAAAKDSARSPHPRWVEGDRPTCRLCLARER